MLYFYDNSGRYIGRRTWIAGEPIPECATETPVNVPDGHEAHFVDGSWAVTVIAMQPIAITELGQTETECLQAQLAQTNADFMNFLDYFFSMFPEAE